MTEEQENTLLSFILLHLFSMNETLGYNDLSTLNDLMLNFKMLCIYFFIVNHNLNLQNFIKNVLISLSFLPLTTLLTWLRTPPIALSLVVNCYFSDYFFLS